MMTIDPRSSMIASAVRKSLSEAGTRLPKSAMTPSEKAMSGRRGDRPADGRARRIAGDRKIKEGGNGHAAERGRGGQRRAASIGKLTLDQLPFDLQPDQHEKDRHQSVVDPQQQGFL